MRVPISGTETTKKGISKRRKQKHGEQKKEALLKKLKHGEQKKEALLKSGWKNQKKNRSNRKKIKIFLV